MAGLGLGTLTHELVHPLIEADFPSAPTWLNEGIATWYQDLLARRAGLLPDDVAYWAELLRGLRTLYQQQENPSLKRVIVHLSDSIESGQSLAEALEAHPKVFNRLYVNMVKALGAMPTPIAWSEVYTALQQKVVDGQENPVATIVQAKLNEVQKYLTLDGHSYGVDFFLINEKFYQGLPRETQELLKTSAYTAAVVGRGVQHLNSATGISE